MPLVKRDGKKFYDRVHFVEPKIFVKSQCEKLFTCKPKILIICLKIFRYMVQEDNLNLDDRNKTFRLEIDSCREKMNDKHTHTHTHGYKIEFYRQYFRVIS